MMPKSPARSLLALVLITLIIPPFRVRADVSSCTATVSPTSLATNTSTQFTIEVSITSDQDIIWFRITGPSINFGFTD